MNHSTLKQYLASKGYSSSSIKGFYRDTTTFINWCEAENIEVEYASYAEILSYVHYLKKREVKQRTIQFYINSISHYFEWCISRHLIEINPTKQVDIKGIKRRSLYHILKREELEELYHNYKVTEATEENKHQNWLKTSQLASRRNKVIVGLMIYQGLGTLELKGLEEKDLKLREGKIYIKASRKSNERTLTLESTQILDLMEYTLQTRKELLVLTQKETALLFFTTGKGSSFTTIMSKLMKKLKAENAKVTHANQIKTSVITYWLQQYNLREVQYRAGHKFVSSTEAYRVNDLEELKEDVNKYHPF